MTRLRSSPIRLVLQMVFAVGGTVSCAPTIDLEPHDYQYAVCGRRAERAPHPDGRGVVGKIRQIVDATQMDGPVQIVVVDPRGDLKKLYFESLFTRAPPSEERQATYRTIAQAKVGDCVRADGNLMSDGKLWVERFMNFDRH